MMEYEVAVALHQGERRREAARHRLAAEQRRATLAPPGRCRPVAAAAAWLSAIRRCPGGPIRMLTIAHERERCP